MPGLLDKHHPLPAVGSTYICWERKAPRQAGKQQEAASASRSRDSAGGRNLEGSFPSGGETLTSDSGVAAAALGQDLTEQVLAATASVVAVVMVAPLHAGA